MKKIRLFLLAFIALFAAVGFVSCNDDGEATYHMQTGDSSDAYEANSSLQALVTNLIVDSDNIAVTYFGTHANAIAWFDIQCDIMEGVAFTSGVDVLDSTSLTMLLINLDNGGVADSRLVEFSANE